MANLLWSITAESAGSSPYEFNSVTAGSDNSFAPSTDQAQAGSYSYKSLFGGSAVQAYGQKTISSSTGEIYLIGYVYLPSDFAFSANSYIPLIYFQDGPTFYGRSLSDTEYNFNRWFWYNRSTYTNYTTNFSLDAWHKVGIYIKTGSGDGICKLTIDDTIANEITTLTISSLPTYVRIGGGYSSSTPVNGSSLYFDSFSCYDGIPASGGNSYYYQQQQM